MLYPVRRIVTTNDAGGRSRVLIGAPAGRTIGVLTQLRLTDRTPASNDGTADTAERSDQLEPPRHGTLFRCFQIAPGSRSSHLPLAERHRLARDWFAEMNGAHLQRGTNHAWVNRGEADALLMAVPVDAEGGSNGG